MNQSSTPNPYQPSQDTTFVDRYHVRMGAGFWLGVAYPFVTLGMLHLIWGLTWLDVGHRPVPMRDDPNFEGADLLMPIAALMIAGSPAILILAIGLDVGRTFIKRWAILNLMGRIALIVLIWAAALAFLRFDPYDLVEWFMD